MSKGILSKGLILQPLCSLMPNKWTAGNWRQKLIIRKILIIRLRPSG